MKKFVKAALCSAAAFLSAPSLAQTAALPDADPAIWVVKDPDTTIYLFGTFHAMDGKHDWFNDEVKTAFDSAREVVLELPPTDNPAELQPVIMKHAVDLAGKPLSEKLSPETREKYSKALADIGVPVAAFDRFRPFFAALTLVMAHAQKLGFSGEKGAEAALTKAARDAGKPISGLETMDFQLSMFADMSEEDQIEMLDQTLDQLAEIGTSFNRMNALWTKGDAEGFAALMQEMNASSPELFKVIFTQRNARWAEWVDQRLDTPGTVFVAVGTGHLAGKDSVQDMLKARGIEAARLD